MGKDDSMDFIDRGDPGDAMDRDELKDFLMDSLERQMESGVTHPRVHTPQHGKWVEPYDPAKDPNVFRLGDRPSLDERPVGYGTISHERGWPPNPPHLPTYRAPTGGVGPFVRTKHPPSVERFMARFPRRGGPGMGKCPKDGQPATREKCISCPEYDPKQVLEPCGIKRKESERLSKK